MVLGGFSCSKNALIALNVLYIMVGILLIGVAAYGRAVAIVTSLALVGGIIACGVFLFLVALVGLVGGQKHHQVLLFFYMIILFLLFLVQFAIACACLAVNKEQQEQIFIQGWNYSHEATREDAQKSFSCCAMKGDLQSVPLKPLCETSACCIGSTAFCCTGVRVNSTTQAEARCPCPGCYETIQPYVAHTLRISGGIGLFFSFTEIVGVWITVRYRNQKDPRANPSAFL